jgi:hypothetical protein
VRDFLRVGEAGAASASTWKRECSALGLIEQDKRGLTSFSKYKVELITRSQIACSETLAWVL